MVLLIALFGFSVAIIAAFVDSSICATLRSNPPVAISQHIKTLARKRAQLVYTDEYGSEILTKWHKECAHFIEAHIAPSLTDMQRRAKFYPIIEQEIERQISALTPEQTSFDRSMPPIQYEHYCAEIMRQAGWQATVTKASGDQGADVIAEANGIRIVLQCKLLNGAVGNKAVQEVSAARLHYGCDHAAVVTHISYTQSAKRLASTNVVSLLHHDDLQSWAQQLMNAPQFARISQSSSNR